MDLLWDPATSQWRDALLQGDEEPYALQASPAAKQGPCDCTWCTAAPPCCRLRTQGCPDAARRAPPCS